MTPTDQPTPGPWVFNLDEAEFEDTTDRYYVCHPGTVCPLTAVCETATMADAVLIAAAHDMLAALKLAAANLVTYDRDGRVQESEPYLTVMAAIRKAEGHEPAAVITPVFREIADALQRASGLKGGQP